MARMTVRMVCLMFVFVVWTVRNLRMSMFLVAVVADGDRAESAWRSLAQNQTQKLEGVSRHRKSMNGYVWHGFGMMVLAANALRVKSRE